RARLRRLWPLGTGAAILFASLLLLMTLGILGSYRHLKTAHASAGWVVHSEDVLGTSERLLSDLQHAETGQLGYLLTGNSTFLEPYRAGVAAYQHEFDRLVLLTADNSLQQHRLALLKPVIQAKIDELAATIDLFAHGGGLSAKSLVADLGDGSMYEIRNRLAEIDRMEESLVNDRTQAAADAYRRSVNISVGCAIATMFLIVLFALHARNDLLDRESLMASLRDRSNQLSRAIGSLHAKEQELL